MKEEKKKKFQFEISQSQGFEKKPIVGNKDSCSCHHSKGPSETSAIPYSSTPRLIH
jgi:hypothetical protein